MDYDTSCRRPFQSVIHDQMVKFPSTILLPALSSHTLPPTIPLHEQMKALDRSKTMKKNAKISLTILASVAVLPILLYVLQSRAQHWVTGIHQQGVTFVFASRKLGIIEESHVTNREEAIHAVDMMKYVQNYYVSGDGYRSNPETENAIATQRQKTLQTIGHALESYSGERYGMDIEKWEKRRDENTTQPR